MTRRALDRFSVMDIMARARLKQSLVWGENTRDYGAVEPRTLDHLNRVSVVSTRPQLGGLQIPPIHSSELPMYPITTSSREFVAELPHGSRHWRGSLGDLEA